MKFALVALFFVESVFPQAPRRSRFSDTEHDQSNWFVYRDKEGLSFRYPPSLIVKIESLTPDRESEQHGFEQWDKEVTLFGPGSIEPTVEVLKFGHLTPASAAAPVAQRLQYLRRFCDRLRPMQMAGA